jgi:hypothetical protein
LFIEKGGIEKMADEEDKTKKKEEEEDKTDKKEKEKFDEKKDRKDLEDVDEFTGAEAIIKELSEGIPNETDEGSGTTVTRGDVMKMIKDALTVFAKKLYSGEHKLPTKSIEYQLLKSEEKTEDFNVFHTELVERFKTLESKFEEMADELTKFGTDETIKTVEKGLTEVKEKVLKVDGRLVKIEKMPLELTKSKEKDEETKEGESAGIVVRRGEIFIE